MNDVKESEGGPRAESRHVNGEKDARSRTRRASIYVDDSGDLCASRSIRKLGLVAIQAHYPP